MDIRGKAQPMYVDMYTLSNTTINFAKNKPGIEFSPVIVLV